MAMARTSGQKQYSGRSGASATFDTEKQRKKNEEMQNRKPRPAPKEMKKGGKCACDGIAQRGKTKARRRA